MFNATCSICEKPITWQEINSGNAIEVAPGEVACRTHLSEEVDIGIGGDDNDLDGLEISTPI